jgi:hypothetical protein
MSSNGEVVRSPRSPDSSYVVRMSMCRPGGVAPLVLPRLYRRRLDFSRSSRTCPEVLKEKSAC